MTCARANVYTWKENLLISIGYAFGVGLFFILHSNAAEYSRQLETDFFYYPMDRALRVAIIVGLILLLLNFLLLMIGIYKNLHQKPLYLSFFTLSIASGISFIALKIEGLVNAYTLTYLLILDAIIGLSISIIYNDINEFNNLNTYQKGNILSFLEKWHAETLQFISSLLYASLLIISAGVIATLAPIGRELPQIKTASSGFSLLLLNHAYIVFFYIFILWFGVFSPLIYRLKMIRIRILQTNTILN